MKIQIKRGPDMLFSLEASDIWSAGVRGCLLSSFNRGQDQRNWFPYGCSYHTWENMQHVWRDSSLIEWGLFPVSINCSKDNLKKIKVNLLICSQKAMHMTKLLVEVNAIKRDSENLWARGGGGGGGPVGCAWAALISLPYIYLISALVCAWN